MLFNDFTAEWWVALKIAHLASIIVRIQHIGEEV